MSTVKRCFFMKSTVPPASMSTSWLSPISYIVRGCHMPACQALGACTVIVGELSALYCQ